ncbi:hypothetical protein MMC14_000783 [Varicellaria rhodocarpa]|nr:hypothetical protein [Varicellaria rhodocarpa]
MPPRIETPTHNFDWIVKPDVTYMSSTTAFPHESRVPLRTYCPEYLADNYSFAPYLTIEVQVPIRRNKQSYALCKNAAASYLRIYQRLQLKIAFKGHQLNEIDFKDLRHYSIVIDTRVFSVWLTTYNSRKKSYQMQILESCQLNGAGILRWVEWWNAIHRWGLGPYARSFQKELESLLAEK